MKRFVSFILLFCFTCLGNSLPIQRQAAFFAQPKAAAGGGGGGCTPSYSNTGGSGDRTGLVTVKFGPNANLVAGSGGVQSWANNAAHASGQSFFNNFTLDGVTTYVIWAWAAPVYFTEDTFSQQDSTSQGTWKWQYCDNTNGWSEGVNDASFWTDAGGTFSMVTSGNTVHSTTSGVSTPHKYWRELGVSGTTSGSPWTYEQTFKICYNP